MRSLDLPTETGRRDRPDIGTIDGLEIEVKNFLSGVTTFSASEARQLRARLTAAFDGAGNTTLTPTQLAAAVRRVQYRLRGAKGLDNVGLDREYLRIAREILTPLYPGDLAPALAALRRWVQVLGCEVTAILEPEDARDDGESRTASAGRRRKAR